MKTELLALALCAALAPAAVRAQAAPSSGVAESARRAAGMRIQPGDRIVLHVLREPELSDTVTVTERGEAAFAKLGVLHVDSSTIAQLTDTLVARYSQYLRTPALEVVVLRRVAVNGEVRNPNVFLVDVATTLRDVIARAGGLTDNASRGKVWIVRGDRRIDVGNWQRDEGPLVDLRSGDQVFVGRKSWWAINALPVASTGIVLASLVITLRR